MTGFGRGERASATARVVVELRSVNHRFLDVQLKAPRALLSLEPQLVAALRDRLERGRVDVFLRRDALDGGGGRARVDVALAGSILAAAREAAAALGVAGELALPDLLQWPGVLSVEEAEVDADGEAPLVLAALGDALTELIAMRAAEGERLRDDIGERLALIEAEVDVIAGRARELPERLSSRLHRRLESLLGDADVDPARLAQEVAILADKAAVDEELTRLRSHIAQARELLAAEGAVGRKLDFLIQEFHREANTIASKSADEAISRSALALKSEIEKIREQVANLE
jgi:uncharacterized protein (TIGR00255 family)